MKSITWLHLSDWHEGAEEITFNRELLLTKLQEDIAAQIKELGLERIDFIVFSGDAAYSGMSEQYYKSDISGKVEGCKRLFDTVLEAAGLDPDNDKGRLFIVPGNHDLNRANIAEYQGLDKHIESEEKAQKWLTNDSKRQTLLSPFKEFTHFVKNYTKQENAEYASFKILDNKVDEKRVVLLGINSAWMAGRKNSEGKVEDYGKLIVGEPQIIELFRKLDDNAITEDDLIIAILHHPLEWLREFDRKKVRKLLAEKCHFILCGHQHEPNFDLVQGIEGNYLIIPAGAIWQRRDYPNSYNFVHLDFESQEGTMYLRRWSNENTKWIRADETYHEGEYPFRIPTKKNKLQRVSFSKYGNLVEELVKQEKLMSVWKELHMKWQNFGCNFTSHRIALTSMQIRRQTDPAYDILKVWPSSSHVNNIKKLLIRLKDMGKSNNSEEMKINEIINTEYERMLTDHPLKIEEINISITNYLAQEDKNILTLDNMLNKIEADITNREEESQQVPKREKQQKREIEKNIIELKKSKKSKEKQRQNKLETILSTYLQYTQSIEQKTNIFLKCLDEKLQDSIKEFHDLLEDLNNKVN